jgi:hypothetical protein
MDRRAMSSALVITALAAAVPARALIVSLSEADVERGLRLSGAFDEQRTAFHAPYLVDLGDATVAQIEVITEFRRLVLLAESHRNQGDWLFTQSPQRAEAALRPWQGLVTIVAHLRFNPQNVLVSAPPYAIEVGLPGRLVPAVETTTTPVTAGLTPRGGTIVGAELEARFESAAIGQTERRVGVSLRGETVAAVDIDFSRID